MADNEAIETYPLAIMIFIYDIIHLNNHNIIKGMEPIPNMLFHKYLFLEVINILIRLVYFNSLKYKCSKYI